MNKHRYPELYQRRFYNRRYFEGWYYKQVTADKLVTLSLIPSVSYYKSGAKAFLQAILLKDEVLTTALVDYPIDHFSYQQSPFLVRIDDHQFSLQDVNINLNHQQLSINGGLELSGITPLKYSLTQPNIMGFFSYIPAMQCNHGIVSMNHLISGSLDINGENIDFSGGKGYIEKDWGSSFPSRYIWLQSNQFRDSSVSLFCSVATIPMLGLSFDGFICQLIIGNEHYRFATYTGAKLKLLKRTDQVVSLVLKSRQHHLTIHAEITQSKPLRAPKHGEMNTIIKEALLGDLSFELADNHGKVIAEHHTQHCGIEIVNQLLDIK